MLGFGTNDETRLGNALLWRLVFATCGHESAGSDLLRGPEFWTWGFPVQIDAHERVGVQYLGKRRF
jgi:hypothetical protein